MYHFRLKIFILLCIGALTIAVGRLVTLQVFQVEQARQNLAEMRIKDPVPLPSIRGKIVDRYDKPLAQDSPAFFLHIKYELTRYADPRWREGQILRAIDDDTTRQEAERELAEKWQEKTEELEASIRLAERLADVSREDIENTIARINDQIWEQARRLGWIWNNPGVDIQEYFKIRDSISPAVIVGTKLRAMSDSYPLIELKTQQDRHLAEVEVLNLQNLKIESKSKRDYPYRSAGCQLIGWVAPWRDDEIELFKDDKYRSYQPGEVIGKSGIESVYEPVLRGRRGEVQYDVEGHLLRQVDPKYGRDVRLTLDIDLQKAVEAALADNTLPHGNKPCAAVVLEAANNDILAMASIPTFDLNTIRQSKNYSRIFNPNDPNKLWQHKAMERNYPPGSTAKPLILVAGMEEKKITTHEAISCTGHAPPKGWPRCLLQRDYGIGHDNHFGPGGNTARNAIRGSCNVYFSQLAHRLSSEQLQGWLFDFGFGQDILKTPVVMDDSPEIDLDDRALRQSHGCLEYAIVQKKVSSASELEPLPKWENKWWGMGQGSLRVNVLQVANALSTIVRDGVYKNPRLVHDENDPQNESGSRRLSISKNTLATVRDGMKAVIYEPHGTAHSRFKDSDLLNRNMTIYGKTGSTQDPSVAWFECFAEEESGRAIVIVVLVERGLSGSGEAAPLGRRILELCNLAGYIGTQGGQ